MITAVLHHSQQNYMEKGNVSIKHCRYSRETLRSIEQSRYQACWEPLLIQGSVLQDQSSPQCSTGALLRRDKERYVRILTEDVKGHANANDLLPAYQALKKL